MQEACTNKKASVPSEPKCLQFRCLKKTIAPIDTQSIQIKEKQNDFLLSPGALKRTQSKIHQSLLFRMSPEK